MHRFRKKSDAKRAQVPEHLIANSSSRSPQPALPAEPVLALPPATNFRTSLILPSLSKRFTLLRTASGDPVSLDDIRSRIAEQRSRGDEHLIYEDEEDMIVDALAKLRSPNSPSPAPSSSTMADFSPAGSFYAQQDSTLPSSSAARDSSVSSSIASVFTPSISSNLSPGHTRSSPTSPSASRTASSPRYSSKRMSNNMFSSGRLHDTSYLRSVSKSNISSSRSTTFAGGDSRGDGARSTRSARGTDITPGMVAAPEQDASGDSSFLPEKAPPSPSSTLTQVALAPVAPPRAVKEFTSQQFRRTSLALEAVIRGIEKESEIEAEETIMVPRTSSRATTNSRTQSPKASEAPSAISTPVPWMTDEARVDDRESDDEPPAAATTSLPQTSSSPPSSPSPRLPGYIPGMTRPLTPRDAESDRDDGATGYSTTPRARSPALPSFSHHSSVAHSFAPLRRNTSMSSDGQSFLPPSILRSSRNSGQQIPPLRTSSPGYNGRSRGSGTNSPQVPSPIPSPSPEERFKNDLLSRRPLSPLSGSQITPYSGGSRPGTPSSPGPRDSSSPPPRGHTMPLRESDLSRPSTPGHSLNGSLAAIPSASLDGSMPIVGSPPPDPSLMGGGGQAGNNGVAPVFGWEAAPLNRNGDGGHNGSEEISLTRHSAVAAKIAARAPTPVHTHSRSPSVSESGHEPMLLNRIVTRKSQRRIHSITPPPQAQAYTPPGLHTPPSSSNSSNLNMSVSAYTGLSPLFSPILNTSATSLVSVGSSYHSYGDENGKKSQWDQLVEYDSQRSTWQEMLNGGGRGLSNTDGTSDPSITPEKELQAITSLTKSDLVLVQNRLIVDAQTRRGIDPPRSPISRRRRASASRASLSQSGRESGTNSPAPTSSQSASVGENGSTSPPPRHSPESTSRANALLDSVLSSIQSQPHASSTPPSSDVPTAEPPSTTDDDSSSRFPSVSSSGAGSQEEDTSALRLKALTEALSVPEQPPQVISNDSPSTNGDPQAPNDGSRVLNNEVHKLVPSLTSDPSQSPEEDSGEATEVPASRYWRSPQPFLSRPPGDSVQLVRDVSQKAAAATAALKSPSQANMMEADASSRRKASRRIDFQKISSPHLVSSSTSVDAVPIAPLQPPAISSTTSSKLSQRFKKLRGTLRTKPPTPNGDEITPFELPSSTSSAQSPLTSMSLQRLPSPSGQTQTLRYKPATSGGSRSAADQESFKVPVPPPPASAGPGIKSFIMGRFWKSKKESENSTGNRSGHRSSESTSTQDRDYRQGYRGSEVTSPHPWSTSRRSQEASRAAVERARSPTPDPATVHQLFNAAEELGLDQGALNELLARSTSITRKPTWSQASNAAAARSVSAVNRVPIPREGNTRRSLDQSRTSEQAVYRPPARPTPVNRPPDGEVVRRTIIFATDSPSVAELDAVVRKNSSPARPHRSESSASLHSNDVSPSHELPVPKIPSPTEPSKEMSSVQEVTPPDQGVSNGSPMNPSPSQDETMVANLPQGEQGQGPALEVLQLANGQVIWSVIDTLRAEEEDDSESLFRRSMASSRGPDEELEVRFKEHRRWSSKGSNQSQASAVATRRRPVAPPAGSARPETKLFKTNSSTIGRLIEDLSKNMDSGSFNFMMRPATAMSNTASASTSFHSDINGQGHQIERELDALIKALNPR